MSIYGNFADRPNQIKEEGQNITVRFKRNGDGTATVSWNIPNPAAGCGQGDGIYDGIVITLDNKPANYIASSPKDGTYYEYDSTADRDLHSADTIETALVIGAFYHDKKTVSIVVNDVQDRTPYYISAYAVDNVGRYHREGVHSYSLPTGEFENPADDTVAEQHILIDVKGGILPVESTGLKPDEVYPLVIDINKKEYKIEINGSDALNYESMVAAINYQFNRLETPIESPFPPNMGKYFYNSTTNVLRQWDGYEYSGTNLLHYTGDLTNVPVGTYWLDRSQLRLWVLTTAGWVSEPVIVQETDPTDLSCYDVWYDGTDVWEFNGKHWCKLCLYTDDRNPLLPPILSCRDYWFSETRGTVTQWSPDKRKWEETQVIYTSYNPNALPEGAYWFNSTDQTLMLRDDADDWTEVVVKIGEVFPGKRKTNGVLWYSVETQELKQWDAAEQEWTDIQVITHPVDPAVRVSCDVWWDSDADALYTWDDRTSSWSVVDNFHMTERDPSFPVKVDECAVWLQPDGTFKKLTKVSCPPLKVIRSQFDPLNLPAGQIWVSNLESIVPTVMFWDGEEWNELTEYVLSFWDIDGAPDWSGAYWFNPLTSVLNRMEATGPVLIEFSLHDVSPAIGDKWLRVPDNVLYVWNGSWVEGIGMAAVELIDPDMKKTDRSTLRFYTRDAGCKYGIEVVKQSDSILTKLEQRIIYRFPRLGATGLRGGSLHRQLGVGDDGSPDERRGLHASIRKRFGYPTVNVELTKDQIDECIDNALLHLRKYSSLGSKRNMFFLDLNPNQQTYLLTNECVGFNKVNNIHGVMRMRGAFYKTAFTGGDIHAYAALQQLYTMGTFDMLSFHLVSSYIEELERLFATRITYQFYPRDRELKIYNHIFKRERALIDATMERSEQELISDEATSLWIKNWATAEAKLLLSQIRGKFQTLPGPNGSTTLNSQELITQGEAEKAELMVLLEDMSMQDMVNVGMRGHFIIG